MLPRPILLAFCANGRRAGKDTAANYVEDWCRAHDMTYTRLAFATKGKILIAKALGIEPSQPISKAERIVAFKAIESFKLDGGLSVEIIEGDGHHLTGREFIINLLEHGMKELFGDNVWTKATLPDVWHPETNVTVITDLRFPTEADRVFDLGGKIVEINRIHAEGGASEGELAKKWPSMPITRIYNDGSLDLLQATIFSLMDDLAREAQHG